MADSGARQLAVSSASGVGEADIDLEKLATAAPLGGGFPHEGEPGHPAVPKQMPVVSKRHCLFCSHRSASLKRSACAAKSNKDGKTRKPR